jgi:hypothetical protein
MLYLESPIFFLNSLQIHRDFQNPNQFYYFPAAPRIYRDRTTGKPAFQLLKYARDVTDNPRMSADTREQIGGGFLTMTVDIGVDDEVLEDTRNKLSAYAEGQVSLAPVPFHTGAVRLVALGAEGSEPGQPPAHPSNVFIEKIFGATNPSLYGDNLALFGAHLSQEGAKLIEDSFEHGGGLIGVVYDLTYTGVRPALEVKAEVDYSRVYNRFEAQIGFQYAMIGVELEATLEWLREEGAIKIEITQYDPEMTAEHPLRREAMDLIKNEIIAKMFKPSLQVPTSSTRSGSQLDQVVRLARDLSQPQPTPPNPGGGTPPGPDTTPPPVTEGERGPTTMEGRANSDGAGGGSGGGPGKGAAGFALSFSLKFVHQDERKKATLDFRVNQAVNRTAAPQGSLTLLTDQLKDMETGKLIREINLDDAFFRELGAHIGVLGDWEQLGIEKIVVNATYQPDQAGPVIHTDGWTFNSPTEPPRPFTVLLDKDNPVRTYRYQTQVFLKDMASVDSKERVLVKEDTTELQELNIHPSNEFRPLIISIEPTSAIDWTKTRQIDVLLKYSDPDNQFQAERFCSFRADRAGAEKWIIYPTNPELRSCQVTLSYHLADEHNTLVKLDPVMHSEEGFTVPGPFHGSRRVDLIPAVDAEDVREITAEVIFEKGGYRFRREETFSADNFKPRSIEIPIPDPDPLADAYQVRWSLVKSNWEVAEFPWKTLQARTCILSDGVHSVETVKLVFTRSVEEAGLSSLIVTLETLTPTGEIVDTDTLMIRGVSTEASTDLLVVQGSPLRYRYRLKKIIGANSQITESADNRDRTIFVDL